MNRKSLLVVVMCLSLLPLVVTSHCATRFAITRLSGNPEYPPVVWPSINNAGQVAGWAVVPDGSLTRAFFWEDGVMTDLGWMDGASGAMATGINDSGVIVGRCVGECTNAFMWKDGVMQDLGKDLMPQAINNSGQVVGYAWYEGSLHACVWQDDVRTDLGTLGGSMSQALAINNLSQIVGWSFGTDGLCHVVLWSNGKMTDLGLFTDPSPSGICIAGINDLGQIACGYLLEDGTYHGFLLENGVRVDLGLVQPIDINNAGQIVGQSPAIGAVIVEKGQMLDLNTMISTDSGWQLSIATGINDEGQIVGTGNYQSLGSAGFLLTPTFEVVLDVRHGGQQGTINLNGNALVQVAILASPDFNLDRIDQSTVRFAGAPVVRWNRADIDSDGDLDLLASFRASTMSLVPGSTEALLTAATYGGMSVEGKAAVRVIGK